MSDIPLLSICIPTYNRSRFLKESLTTIIFSAQNHWAEVEIIVSDNASPDDTSAVMSEFQNQYPWIRYHRNDTNIGEANFYHAAAMATGAYVWIFGDDDKLLPEAIPTVLQQIKDGYDQIILNFSIWSRNFDAVKVEDSCGKLDRVFDDPKIALQQFSARLGFISIVVMKKSLVDSVDASERDALIAYGASFLFLVYAVAALARKSIYIGTPQVQARSGNSPMSADLWNQLFITGSHLTFNAMLTKGYSPQAIRAANQYVLAKFISPVVLARKRDSVSVKGLFTFMFAYYKSYPQFWIYCVPAILVPGFVPILATRVVRALRARRRTM